jgi:hypothetical protein
MIPYARPGEEEPTMTDLRGVLPTHRPPVDATVLDEPTSEVPVITPAGDRGPESGSGPDAAAPVGSPAGDPDGSPDPAGDDQEEPAAVAPRADSDLAHPDLADPEAPEPEPAAPDARETEPPGPDALETPPAADPLETPPPTADALETPPAADPLETPPAADPLETPPAADALETPPPTADVPQTPPTAEAVEAPPDTFPHRISEMAKMTWQPAQPVTRTPAPVPATPSPVTPVSPAAPLLGSPAQLFPARRQPSQPEPSQAGQPVPAGRPGDVAERPIALWSDAAAEQLRERWREVQGQFIDDPDAAVTGAKSLVTEAVRALADTLLAAQDELDPYRSGDRADTETMRIAMRRYREFLERVLAL